MPYAKRDEHGNILALFSEAREGAEEWVDANQLEVRQFIGIESALPIGDHLLESLSSSDMQMVRVLEDLLEVLIANKVILFTDLPMPAQVKLLERRSARRRLNINDDQSLVSGSEDESILL